VFQAFNLVASLTAEQNITLPLRLARRGLAQDPAADTAGGGDDRELHGVLQVQRVSWARWG